MASANPIEGQELEPPRVDREFCNRKKSGELYWEAASISPVRAADGEIRQFLAIKEDVTEIKRTAEVLARAKDTADAANRAKSTFLASMSHEIRTPLNAILGYSQLVLRDDSLGAGSRESLQIINRSGEHLLALINDILEVAKIEAGRVGLKPAEFDLYAMLDDLAAMFRLPTMGKGIGFEVTKAKDLPRYIIADEGKTRQVLMNLLSNAVKFTKRGHVRVGAVASQSETGQLWLAVEVEDTGSGIAPEEMGQLFQYFEQTRSGRETQSGTGLGLVISREYARRMGGDISVASEPGKGSVFRFELPIAPIEAKPAGQLPDGRRVVGLAPGQAPLRVLVVDDHASNRGYLCALLESVGFEVHEAGNGQEALEIWQAWRPELILMDIRMPLMDGYEATRRIRLAPGGDSTVIIAVTASALDERLAAMLDAGMDDLVCKPFKEWQLFEKISTHLKVKYRSVEWPCALMPDVVSHGYGKKGFSLVATVLLPLCCLAQEEIRVKSPKGDFVFQNVNFAPGPLSHMLYMSGTVVNETGLRLSNVHFRFTFFDEQNRPLKICTIQNLMCPSALIRSDPC